MIRDKDLEEYPITKYVLQFIKDNDLLFAKTIGYILNNFDKTYLKFSEDLLTVFKKKYPKDEVFDDRLRSIIKFSHEFLTLQMKLQKEGQYLKSSFDDVNKTVYQDKMMNDYYLDGLFLSQILWPNHYKLIRFFIDQNEIISDSSRILEVPSGAGVYPVYISSFFNFESLISFDISPYAVEYTKEVLNLLNNRNKDKVSVDVGDIFKYKSGREYDVIVCGELLEHVDEPNVLLEKVHSLLKENGKLFLTTAIYAAEIDHIYLFNNVREVRDLLSEKFRIDSEIILPVSLEEYDEDMDKMPINYGCYLAKKV